MKKTLIHLIFALAFVTGMGMLTSCGGDSQDGNHHHTEEHAGDHDHDGADHDHANENSEEAVDKTGPEYTSAYICPMHCKGSGSDEAGKCPTCGMEYVASAEGGESHDSDGHDQDGGAHDHH